MTVDIQAIAERLAYVDNLEDWPQNIRDLSGCHRNDAYEAAEPLWVKRMIDEGRLLVHPEVIIELRALDWRPTDAHRRMIWASILASTDGAGSKDTFRRIRSKIIKKYGQAWWEDIYRRIKPAYAAKERIKNQVSNTGPALQMLARNSVFISSAIDDERQQALRMIPKA